jgi:hypothetical protein
MEKIIFETKVTVQGNEVWIEQPDFGDGSDNIYLHVDQIDLLITWLQEAKQEILEAQNDNERSI